MPSFSVHVSNLPEGKRFSPSADQLRNIGEAAIEAIKNRLKNGVDIEDRAAKALNSRYAKRKQGIQGKPAVRNLELTGFTLSHLVVLSADQNSVVIGFDDATAVKRMLFNQNIDPEFGLSPNDTVPVGDLANQFLQQNLNNS